jgi:hypothetical protein
VDSYTGDCWIKQNLRIKSFIGTSQNAVMTQVWAAMILYLLLSFIKYQTRFKESLTELLRIFREVLLERVSLIEYLRTTWDELIKTGTLVFNCPLCKNFYPDRAEI